MSIEQAQCPQCEEWSEVEWEHFVYAAQVDDGEVTPGYVSGIWWKDSAGCPNCDATVLVESECNFRKIENPSQKGGE